MALGGPPGGAAGRPDGENGGISPREAHTGACGGCPELAKVSGKHVHLGR